MGESTAKHRTVSTLFKGEPDDEGVPVSRVVHERSGEFAKAMLGQLDAVVSERMDDAIKLALEEGFTKLFDRFASEVTPGPGSTTTSGLSPQASPPPRGTLLPWIIVGVLATVTVAGSALGVWDKLRYMQSQQDTIVDSHASLAERQSRLEQQQESDDNYDRSVAHYLVIKSANDFANAERMDEMMRVIAKQVGADVSAIALPKESNPPTVVQDRNREFKTARGE